MRPVRGQVVSVKAPWIKHLIIDPDINNMTHIIPRSKDVLLGYTADDNSWDETVISDTSEAIRSRCEALLPSLCTAEVAGEWTGCRPFRRTVRLEVEKREGVQKSVIIHCYGHGGQGVVLHWGCALEVGELVENHLSVALDH